MGNSVDMIMIKSFIFLILVEIHYLVKNENDTSLKFDYKIKSMFHEEITGSNFSDILKFNFSDFIVNVQVEEDDQSDDFIEIATDD